MLKVLTVSAVLLAVGLPLPAAFAQEKHDAQARAFVEGRIRKLVEDPVVIAALKEQNARSAALSQADIDALDKRWRAETKAAGKPLVDGVLGNPVSALLKKAKADSKGLITEIFVMDARGLNVGQSDVTSDYWQGDEAKWQKTFPAGPKAIFVDKVEQDESSQRFQSQVSMTIADPSGAAVGSVTVGLDLDELMSQ